MNPEVKELWITALESGEFPQAQGALKTEDGFCCLGVLCELAVRNGVIPAPRLVPAGDLYSYGPQDEDVYVLPDTVEKWAGIHSSTAALPKDSIEVKGLNEDYPDEPRSFGSLTELNDYAKYDFKQIAQVIREQF